MAATSIIQHGNDIQRALDSGATTVRIPKGTYRTSGIKLPSVMHLIADPEARIVLEDGAGHDNTCFLLSNADPDSGNTDITVEGGVWDGNCPTNPRGPDEPNAYSGVLASFVNVTHLTLKNLTLTNPESYYVRLSRVQHFRIEHLRFEAEHHRPNQDGIHMAGHCSDGVIRDLVARGPGVTQDDLVAFVCDDQMHLSPNAGMVCGPIRRVEVEHLRCDDCHSIVRLGSVFHPIEDVTVRDVVGGCRVCAVNADALRYCLGPVFDPDDPQHAEGVGLLRNIELDDWTVWKSGGDAWHPLFLLETRMQGFTLTRARRDTERDQLPQFPLLRVGHVRTDALEYNGQAMAPLSPDEPFVRDDGEIERLHVASCAMPNPAD